MILWINVRSDDMIIAMACTKDWYHYLMVDIYSLLECTKSIKKIYLLLETDKEKEIENLNQIKRKYSDVEIVVINFNDFLFKRIQSSCPNLNPIYSNFCFAKIMLSDIVSENKVLYIDTDAIVKRDISNLWNYKMDDYYVAGVKDFGIFSRGTDAALRNFSDYINSGVVLFNLNKMRSDGIQEQMLDVINSRKLQYPDQDALNMVCHNHILMLPSIYNHSDDFSLEARNQDLIKIYHFAGPKNFWVTNRLYAEEWYEVEEKFHSEFGW